MAGRFHRFSRPQNKYVPTGTDTKNCRVIDGSKGRDCLGLKLDDPSFNVPIYADLFDEEYGEILSFDSKLGRCDTKRVQA